MPDEDVDGAVARREGQRHELALVAQLGDEDDGEAEEERVELKRHLAQPMPVVGATVGVWRFTGNEASTDAADTKKPARRPVSRFWVVSGRLRQTVPPPEPLRLRMKLYPKTSDDRPDDRRRRST